VEKISNFRGKGSLMNDRGGLETLEQLRNSPSLRPSSRPGFHSGDRAMYISFPNVSFGKVNGQVWVKEKTLKFAEMRRLKKRLLPITLWSLGRCLIFSRIVGFPTYVTRARFCLKTELRKRSFENEALNMCDPHTYFGSKNSEFWFRGKNLKK
jgi:hypothetical protein